MTTAPNATRPDPLGGHSGQWGLAALLIAFMTIIIMPIELATFSGLLIGAWHINAVEWRHIEYSIIGCRVLIYGLLALALLGLFCGFMGLARAVRRKQPFGLSVAGTATAVLAVATAGLLVGAGEYMIEDTRRLRAEHRRFRPANAELIQEVKAAVEKYPRLKPQWEQAMKDRVLTELEAEEIMLASGLWKRVSAGPDPADFFR